MKNQALRPPIPGGFEVSRGPHGLPDRTTGYQYCGCFAPTQPRD